MKKATSIFNKTIMMDQLNAIEGADTDPYAGVRPTGWLWERLKNISNPKKHRWNAYLRACKRIPKTSPVYGCTSFKRLNARRHELIDKEFLGWAKDLKPSPELEALGDAVGAYFAGPATASMFLSSRLFRRLEKALSKYIICGLGQEFNSP